MKFYRVALCLSLAIVSHAAFGEGTTDLLEAINKNYIEVQKTNRSRENLFRTDRKKLQQKHKELSTTLAQLNAETAKLRDTFKTNEQKLAALESDKQAALGVLGEVFGVVRLVAGDTIGQFKDSIITTEFKTRVDPLVPLADAKKLPKVAEIAKLWHGLQQEILESGRISQFESEYINRDGQRVESKIYRLGSFNLVHDHDYLVTYQGNATPQVLPRQPDAHLLEEIGDEAWVSGAYVPVGLDPSRGSLLKLLVQAPSMLERIQQGGAVGYVILALLAIGLLIVIERMISLGITERRIHSQLSDPTFRNDNPLGRILATVEDSTIDSEVLERKLDEAILKETPAIERRVRSVKLLASIAPLLGLLGTVTGMIATFQSITLFGSGDPKLMAGGISQALVTTVLGLVAAIPLLIFHNIIAEKSKGLVEILDQQSAGVIASRIGEPS